MWNLFYLVNIMIDAILYIRSIMYFCTWNFPVNASKSEVYLLLILFIFSYDKISIPSCK